MKKIITALITITSVLISSIAYAESTALATQTGSDVGASFSVYKYQEPGLMSLKGAKIGLDLRTTKALQGEQFIRGELRYAFGTVNYDSNGTGSANGEPDLYFEARALLGKDWRLNNAIVAGYTGIGYRFLFNDGRGITSTGHAGYRRESNYLYLPIGISYRSLLNEQARLVTTLEYDHLLAGKQYTQLSDVGSGYSDVANNQHRGYGLKLSAMYEKDRMIIGPYLHYWNIDHSNVVPEIRNGVWTGMGLLEPKNNTTEFGLKIGQRF